MRRDRPDRRAPDVFICPTCGALVERGAQSCPECGADDRTGWSETAGQWDPDIPTGYAEDDFDYEEFVRREFGEKGGAAAFGVRSWLLAAIAVGLCLLLLLLVA